jgi:hypothetical protein
MNDSEPQITKPDVVTTDTAIENAARLLRHAEAL